MEDDFFLKQRWGGFLLKKLREKKPWQKNTTARQLTKAVKEQIPKGSNKKKWVLEFEKECPENEGAGLLWRIKHYTSNDDLAKEYLELLGDATAEASGESDTAGGGAEGARRSFLDLAIEATKIEQTLLRL